MDVLDTIFVKVSGISNVSKL